MKFRCTPSLLVHLAPAALLLSAGALLPQTTLDEARAVAERIRIGIRHEVGAKFSTPPTITASFGVSSTRLGGAVSPDFTPRRTGSPARPPRCACDRRAR